MALISTLMTLAVTATTVLAANDYAVSYWDIAPRQADAGAEVEVRCHVLQSGALAHCESLGDATLDAAAWEALRHARARVDDWRPGLVATVVLQIETPPTS